MITVSKNIGMIDSSRLAEYILKTCGPMSHLKLQKLIFYIQAYHLAYTNSPIIEDDFEAWVHGPVSRKLYNEIKDYSVLYSEIRFEQNDNEPMPEKVLADSLTEEQMNLINDVLNGCGNLSDLELENMTHSEQPWITARKGYGTGDKCNVVITKDSIKEFYRTQLYGEFQI
jgi:uncharacterized phage-associated protein